MSILKPRGLQRSGEPAELEGNIGNEYGDKATPFAKQIITRRKRFAN